MHLFFLRPLLALFTLCFLFLYSRYIPQLPFYSEIYSVMNTLAPRSHPFFISDSLKNEYKVFVQCEGNLSASLTLRDSFFQRFINVKKSFMTHLALLEIEHTFQSSAESGNVVENTHLKRVVMNTLDFDCSKPVIKSFRNLSSGESFQW